MSLTLVEQIIVKYLDSITLEIATLCKFVK